MGKLDGKIALITGGNSGIGLATVKHFVQEGAYMFITGRTQSKLDKAVKEVGSNVAGVQGDVASFADLDRLFAQIKREEALDEASRLELGFPYDLHAKDMLRTFAYGGMRDRILA